MQLYYYDGAIYLENGSAYRTSGLFPDYSTLGEHLLTLYNATDVTQQPVSPSCRNSV